MGARLFLALCLVGSTVLLFRSWSNEETAGSQRPQPARSAVRAMQAGPAASAERPPRAAAVVPPPPATSAVAATPGAVTLSLDVPPHLKVGETIELRIAIDAQRAVGQVALTVDVDPNVVQVRGAAEGDWPSSSGMTGGFSTDIGADDRLRIKAGAKGPTMVAGHGCFVVVQLQAVAPGTSTIRVNDITVTDSDRRAIPFTATRWASVTAESDKPAPSPAG